MMVKFLQINIGECRAAHDLMLATASQMDVGVILVSEPNRTLCKGLDRNFMDQGGRAAIIVTDEKLLVMDVGTADTLGFRWITIDGVRIYSCYWPPTRNCADLDRFVNFLDRLELSVKSAEGPVIVAGDFNAKSPVWGGNCEDRNGRVLTDFMASNGLIACNSGDIPTFIRVLNNGVSRSYIDITFVSETLNRDIHDWRVHEDYSMSLHQYISFKIELRPERTIQRIVTNRWAWKKLEPAKLQAFLDSTDIPPVDGAQSGAQILSQILEDACNSCMPRGKYSWGKKPTYWWTKEIDELRKLCLKARRAYKRKSRRERQEEIEELRVAYKEARRNLKSAIRVSKKNCWKELCAQVDNDPWGIPYKIVTKNLIGRKPIPELSIPGHIQNVVDTLFPVVTPIKWPILDTVTIFPEVTCQEIKDIIHRIPTGKAPGPDGVPDRIIKLIAEHRPEFFVGVFNACFRDGVFPTLWKKAKLVLLQKGNKPLDQPSSYRPICLLNTCGKFLERLVKNRLEIFMVGNCGLNARQFGFRRGRSTVDAVNQVMEVVKSAGTGPLRRRQLCALVTLDVANAFNSARWDKIEAALCRKCLPDYMLRILRSYFNNRELLFDDSDNCEVSREVTCGVPQGSVLGPLLWNIMYDGLLDTDLGVDCTGFSSSSLVAFADDVAIIATGRDTANLVSAMNSALAAVADWMMENGLKLSVHKTEAVMLTSKRGYEKPSFTINGESVQFKNHIRYLGVELSKSMGFKTHIQIASAKAEKTAAGLSRILPNVGGSRQRTRKVLSSAVLNQILYAAPVWSDSLVYESYVNMLERPQRTIALRVAMGYRTVSTQAVLVVAGLIPAHLMAMERTNTYNGRKAGSLDTAEARNRTLLKWQEEWDSSETGRWTHRLIRDVKKWVSRKFGDVDFHITQMLTGHGCFGQYLHRFKKLNDPKCVDCGESVDDAEHTFFRCDRWWRQRRELEVALGSPLEPETIVCHMLQNKEKWREVKQYVNMILATKEEEERKRQL